MPPSRRPPQFATCGSARLPGLLDLKIARGAASNPPNRFERLALEPDPDWYEPDERPLETRFYRDHSSTVLTRNDSPDVGFEVSLNPYRGCEHGCIYCYARPTHEYLGFSSGLDFETRILVKEDAPTLLRRELAGRHWKPQCIALSGVTDPYQPVERKLQLTRRCLEVLAECRNPVSIVTKNQLVVRDLSILQELARYRAVSVQLSMTTLDPELRRVLEPRTSPPPARLRAISELAGGGIPVGVLVAPLIPGLNDHELPRVLEAVAKAGAGWAAGTVLRLPHAVEPLFLDWLGRHFPDRRDKVVRQLRALREGALDDSRFGSRMTGTGVAAARLHRLLEVARRRAGLAATGPELSVAGFRRPAGSQLELW